MSLRRAQRTRQGDLKASDLCVRSLPTDSQAEQEEDAVHLAAVRRQRGCSDHDPHLAELAGGVHQQLPVRLRCQQLVRTPVGRRN